MIVLIFRLLLLYRCLRCKYIKAVTQMRKQNHLDWKKGENHFNQLEIHQPRELLKYILFLLSLGCWFLRDHWFRKERKCDDQRKRVTSIDVIYGVMSSFIIFTQLQQNNQYNQQNNQYIIINCVQMYCWIVAVE
ncbi:Hypothetical_protein [Hexamita inflata]|uniref:Hypothetical_protein n=1 Tax=Hexamita inflata TaxID=28002 RepID=A0AA86PPH9_9EUKA|nr:Hypothetical protein HINF_LOCUS26785 [Hexamita inflata]